MHRLPAHLHDPVRRIHCLYKALGCSGKPSQTLFSTVLLDGRYVNDLIRVVYDCPAVMRYFAGSWAVFIDVVHTRIDVFDVVMDKIAASLDDTVTVHIRPESLADVRVGRVMIHMLHRYSGRFEFKIGGDTCRVDTDVLDLVLRQKN